MALQFVTKVCTGCGKEFRTSNDSNHCYNCCLDDITHGMAPEEGDFNTARIISGTLSAQERRNLQSDLEQVECGMTTEEEWGVEEEPDDDWQNEEDEEEDEYYDDGPDDWEYDEWEDAKWGHEG